MGHIHWDLLQTVHQMLDWDKVTLYDLIWQVTFQNGYPIKSYSKLYSEISLPLSTYHSIL